MKTCFFILLIILGMSTSADAGDPNWLQFIEISKKNLDAASTSTQSDVFYVILIIYEDGESKVRAIALDHVSNIPETVISGKEALPLKKFLSIGNVEECEECGTPLDQMISDSVSLVLEPYNGFKVANIALKGNKRLAAVFIPQL